MRVVEAKTGAQVLPQVRNSTRPFDERATISSWEAHLAMDADLRAKSEAHQRVAERLHVEGMAQHDYPTA